MVPIEVEVTFLVLVVGTCGVAEGGGDGGWWLASVVIAGADGAWLRFWVMCRVDQYPLHHGRGLWGRRW